MCMAWRIDDAKAAVAPGDPWLYRITLPPVGAGLYTVSWRVMSADDGHVTEGAYVFVVGGTARSLPTADSQVIAVTGWLDALARWIGMLSAAALIGMLTASGVFWRRQQPRVPSTRYILPCLVALLLAACYTLFARLQRLPVEESGWTSLALLLSSNIGLLTAAKIGLALLLVGALVGYRCVPRGRTWFWVLALFLTVMLLVSDALVSHSAATVAWRGLAIGAEIVHLCGIALWLGGLGYFATLFWWSTFREQSPAAELAWAIPTFSLLAVGAVGLLTVSGLYLTRLHLGSFAQLLSTSYGRVLLAKLGVVATMLALGGYHQFIVHPRMLASLTPTAGGEDLVSQPFRKTLRIEALLGLLALLLAAVLGTTSPPVIAPIPVAETFRQSQLVDGMQITIEVWPVRPGPNTIRLSINDGDGHALSDATAALLQLQVEDTETAPMGVALAREAPGIFVGKLSKVRNSRNSSRKNVTGSPPLVRARLKKSSVASNAARAPAAGVSPIGTGEAAASALRKRSGVVAVRSTLIDSVGRRGRRDRGSAGRASFVRCRSRRPTPECETATHRVPKRCVESKSSEASTCAFLTAAECANEHPRKI